MANNTTDTSLHELIPKFSVYVVEGFFLALANAIIFAAIIRQRLLREKKQYLLAAGLALADGLNGFATLMAGIGRIYLIMSRKGYNKVSRWDCLLTPWNQLYIWTDPLQAVMLLVTSIDRLIAVGWPLHYYGYDTKYAHKMNGGAYGLISLVVMIGHMTSYQHQSEEVPSICFTAYSLDDIFYKFHNYCRVIPGTLSIGVYCMAVYYLRKNKIHPLPAKAGPHEVAAYNIEQKVQRKFTVTLGISSGFTLIFYVIPMLVEIVHSFLNPNDHKTLALIVPYIFIINNLNPMFNLYLYTTKQKDIMLAVKCLFKCKTLTMAMINEEEIRLRTELLAQENGQRASVAHPINASSSNRGNVNQNFQAAIVEELS